MIKSVVVRSSCYLTLSLVSLFFICNISAASDQFKIYTDEEDQEAYVSFQRSMTRTSDFIIVRGKKLRNNLNKDIKNMTLFAFRQGQFRPIPFQIDEIGRDGEWILTQYPEYLKAYDFIYIFPE